MTAQQELSKLWANSSKEPYTILFNNQVNARQLYRKIEVKREVEKMIGNLQDNPRGKTETALFIKAWLLIDVTPSFWKNTEKHFFG